MTIELPGFETAVQNKVYIRDSELKIPDSEYLALKAVIIPQRFTQPSPEDVIGLIVERARKIMQDWQSFVVSRDFSKIEGMDKIFSGFTEQSIENIAGEYHEAMDELMENMSVPQTDSDKKYLFLRYGIISADIVQCSSREGMVPGLQWYLSKLADKEFLQHGLGERFCLTLLLEGNVLPPKNDIEMLIKRKTYGSDILLASTIDYSPVEAGIVLRAVYSGIDVPEKIMKLDDISGIALEQEAGRTLGNLYNTLVLEGREESEPENKNGNGAPGFLQ